MKATISERYGAPEVVEIRDVPKPVPQPDEVLIKIYATTVTRTDCGMRTPYPFFMRPFIGMLKPKTTNLGLDFAGVIEAAGNDVTLLKSGDRVFGISPDTYGSRQPCVDKSTKLLEISFILDYILYYEGRKIFPHYRFILAISR